ncbi:hypothetical protein B0H14DRAFT_3438571 [Mycena olivaceomarginata]|nr:hypothetical protein B0H14DRAFT_3438571 [Mycena olivaceomarginata]
MFLDFFLHLVGHPGKIPSMGLSTKRYEALKTVSTRFLTEKNFGFNETEGAMAAVFGNDRSSIEAKAWTTVLSTAGSPEPVVVDAAKKPVKNTKTKWVEEDVEWDVEAW